MILDGKYPPDIRVNKEIKALVNAGHDVYVLSSYQIDKEVVENYNGATVVRKLPEVGSFKQKLSWGICHSIHYHPLLRTIQKFVNEYDVEVLHVHDLPLFWSAYSAKGGKRKIILDLHENYPAALVEWFSERNVLSPLLLSTLLNYRKWLTLEKNAISLADYVITVIDEMKYRLIRLHEADESKIAVIPNTESVEFLNEPISENILNRYEGFFVVSYIGGFGRHRGIETLVKAAKVLTGEIQDLKILVVGAGSNFRHLIDLSKTLNVDRIVEFTGWVPPEVVRTYVEVSSIGVIPHVKNEHTENTIPHKLFQYMITKKPVIVSDCTPLKRIVSSIKSGLVFKSADPKELANKILVLYGSKSSYIKFSHNAKKHTINGKWNWESSSRELIKLYNSI